MWRSKQTTLVLEPGGAWPPDLSFIEAFGLNPYQQRGRMSYVPLACAPITRAQDARERMSSVTVSMLLSIAVSLRLGRGGK
jgi:hypothetical protein